MQLSGFLTRVLEEYNTPHYSILHRKINHLDVDIDYNARVSNPTVSLTDSSGLKQCNRREQIHQKCKVRRESLKVHVLADGAYTSRANMQEHGHHILIPRCNARGRGSGDA